MQGFFQKIFENIKNIFWGRNLLWHFAAIFITYFLVNSGFDWIYYKATRNAYLQSFFFPAVLFGAIIPLFGILIFFAVSVIRKNRKLINTAFALGQAALLGLFISDFYKAFTGRVRRNFLAVRRASTSATYLGSAFCAEGYFLVGPPLTRQLLLLWR